MFRDGYIGDGSSSISCQGPKVFQGITGMGSLSGRVNRRKWLIKMNKNLKYIYLRTSCTIKHRSKNVSGGSKKNLPMYHRVS